MLGAKDLAQQLPDLARDLAARLEALSKERPPLLGMDRLMSPALPWVYGQEENAEAPDWVREWVREIRATQPTDWAPGTTPWPQAPKDGKILYTGDGR